MIAHKNSPPPRSGGGRSGRGLIRATTGDRQGKPLPQVKPNGGIASHAQEWGEKGEEWVNKILVIKHGAKIRESDGWIKVNGEWCLKEIKNQEPYEPPPFSGQGLPPHQFDFYMDLFRQRGVRCLFIVDNERNELVAEFLDVLAPHATNIGDKNPRVIFPLSIFKPLFVFEESQDGTQ